jgi:aquaporin Z
MRAVDIRLRSSLEGLARMSASFKKNRNYYLQEALGLGIFMISACFFSGLLFGKDGLLVLSVPDSLKIILLGILMGATALFIFYSPFTSPSGSHINPAVTLAFFRLNKIDAWDSFFYIIFQTIGGIITVYIMAYLMGPNLTAAPLHDVATVPGKFGPAGAAITEILIAFVMMSAILFTSDHRVLKKYTRIISACLVSVFVMIASPISGFGMNPARSFASALPSNVWTSFWIYICMPLAGMLGAAEYYRVRQRNRT